jgi:diacylglycerol diphosphate phosphatase/phosphatidate phosphatase
MGIFNRRAAPIDANTTTATGEHVAAPVEAKHHGHHGGHAGNHPASFSARPTFGQWLKATSLDLLTMLILGAIGLGVSFDAGSQTR